MAEIDDRGRSDDCLIRIGAWGGIIGSLMAMAGNLLHPATPTGDPEGVARAIAESGSWVAVHLVIVVGLILMLGGLLAIAASIRTGPAGALARLARSAAIAGVTVGLVLVIVDGVAAKHLADAWAAAPQGEAASALQVVVAEESINFALAALFNILFAGVTFILLGLAVALSGRHPRWPAWIVVAAGIMSVPVGLVQAFEGESTSLTRVATIIAPTILTIWVAWMSVRLIRKKAAAAGGEALRSGEPDEPRGGSSETRRAA
jgi:hypothetical protein